MKSGMTSRVGVILLAAAPVIAITWAQFSPYDVAGHLAAREAAAKGQAPAPGAEAVLRRHIAAPRPQRNMDATKLGPPQSIGYLGSESEPAISGLPSRIDNFRVTYRDGPLVWRVGLGRKGVPDLADYSNPEPPTPAQMIAGFSGVRASRVYSAMAEKFALLLVVAVMCRFVLRVRL